MSAGDLRCRECGERVVRGRAPGTFTHVTRLVASCDLDSDHRVTPDWQGLGEVPCRRCGESVIAEGAEGAFVHRDPVGDADHPAEPALGRAG
jgi:hypothetical protein